MCSKLKRPIAYSLFISAIITSSPALSWGQNGHRVVGQLAENHISEVTKSKLLPILNGQTLAQISTWPDEMRSSPEKFWQKKSSPWHYINASSSEAFSFDHNHTKNKDTVSNILEGIYYTMNTLKNSSSTIEEKQFSLRFLVHLVGDSHQPFHAGRSEDRGGNKINVLFFQEKTNLHSLWDTKLVENQNLSFSELTQFIDTNDNDIINSYLNSTPIDWLKESHTLAENLYKSTNDEVSYSYIYNNTPVVNKRLQKAGIRLAGVLNKLFDGNAKNAISLEEPK